MLRMAGPIETAIRRKLTSEFSPKHLAIANDSHKHAHHAGLRGATNTTESHFRITIVSDKFAGVPLPARHRLVYKVLDHELQNEGVHALQLKTKTEPEWEREQNK
ncbi:hypothetical protein KL928_000655 [Ogataea angusta]|uniref:BolA-like protein n=1 Tax=Pichia angusta TaxID=870730 RepID=A0AAN6DKF7_PICAN|nr:uncharacterized protein KL928_000655 [Ogataea angusta]KAG7822180.1 hypothetical protein KL928_000655 [Ogataea angusta]KAG7832443.1 hypothetical protein KL943_005101 [Ogataea angusta]KAG7862818.1 hypothetical protein KL939_000137 [Ogataea angusta]